MKIAPKNFLKNPLNWFAIGFGSGLSPLAPGTCGTIVAVLIFMLLSKLALLFYILILALMVIFGILICDTAERQLKKHDPSSVVWDEIVGYLVTMLAIPATWLWILLGFILFRAFDIWKPWPINLINNHVKGGLGIIADDLIAGVYAWVILKVILLIFT